LYDFLIVGGRVAGASTAILLAQAGCRVAVLNSDRRPGPVLSTHVFGDWAAFGRLGVLDDPRLASAPAMSRFRTDVEGCVVETDLLATPYARALRREVLDPMLGDYARRAGDVTWWDDARVVGLLRNGATVTGVRAVVDGAETAVPARVVVGADGRNSIVARAVGATPYLQRPRLRFAYFGYFARLVPAPLPTLEYYWHGADVVIVAPCDGDLHVVCVMPRDDTLDDRRHRHEERFARTLASIRTLAPRLANATRIGPVHATGNLRSYLRTPAGAGWALVGDAGAAVHPCIGAGIDHAVFSAGAFADATRGHVADGVDWCTAMDGYRQARDVRIRPTLLAAARLANRGPLPADRVAWLHALLGMPGSVHDLGGRAEDVVRTVSGDDAADRLSRLIGTT
jgi:flavin-dependent dehydrogenase